MALRTTAQGGSVPAGGGAFQTDLEAMDSAVQYVRQVGDTMTGRVQRLFAEIEAELNPGTWQGEAAHAYARAKERWGVRHQAHVRVLDHISTHLHKSRTGYHQTDQDNTAGITNAVRGLTD